MAKRSFWRRAFLVRWRFLRFRWSSFMKYEPESIWLYAVVYAIQFAIRLFLLLIQAGREFVKDNGFLHGAALAYYTIFSLPPMLLIISLAASSLLDEATVKLHLVEKTRILLGDRAAEQVGYMIQQMPEPSGHGIAALIGIGTLLLSSTAVFYNMQNSLNTFWKVAPKIRKGLKELVIDRLLAFLMVLLMGIILLIALLVETIVGTVNRFFSELFPYFQASLLLASRYFIVFFVLTLLFSLIFKYLPNAILKWKDMIIGAGFTAFLFLIGQMGIAWYIQETDFSTTYGAAGSVIIILAWVFYSAQIIYFGAEFTFVFARRYGSEIHASSHKRKILGRKKTQIVPEPVRSPVSNLSTNSPDHELPKT